MAFVGGPIGLINLAVGGELLLERKMVGRVGSVQGIVAFDQFVKRHCGERARFGPGSHAVGRFIVIKNRAAAYQGGVHGGGVVAFVPPRCVHGGDGLCFACGSSDASQPAGTQSRSQLTSLGTERGDVCRYRIGNVHDRRAGVEKAGPRGLSFEDKIDPLPAQQRFHLPYVGLERCERHRPLAERAPAGEAGTRPEGYPAGSQLVERS